MSTTYNATRNANGTYTTTDTQPSKLKEAARAAGIGTAVTAAGTAYVAVSALATFGLSKLGEKIWDWM